MRYAFFSRVAFLENRNFLKTYEFSTIFGILEKTPFGVMKTCILTVLRIIFEEKYRLGEVLSFIFLDIERKLSSWWQHVFGGEKFYLLGERIIFWKHIFWKSCILHFFRSLSKKSSNSRQYFSGGIVRTAFYGSRGTMWVYTFSENIITSLFFWILSEEVPHFQQKFSGRLVKTAFFCVQKNIFDENFFFNYTKLYS